MLTADFQTFMPDPDFGPTSPIPVSQTPPPPPAHRRGRGRPKTNGGSAKSNKRARPSVAEDEEDGGDAETVIRPSLPPPEQPVPFDPMQFFMTTPFGPASADPVQQRPRKRRRTDSPSSSPPRQQRPARSRRPVERYAAFDDMDPELDPVTLGPIAAAYNDNLPRFESLSDVTRLIKECIYQDMLRRTNGANNSIHSGGGCLFCDYGNRTVDGTTLGFGLFEQMLRAMMISYESRGSDAALMVGRKFYDLLIVRHFDENGRTPPPFLDPPLLLHLETLSHSINNRLYIIQQIRAARNMQLVLENEISEKTHGVITQKILAWDKLSARLERLYNMDPRRLPFGAPLPEEISPMVSAYISETLAIHAAEASGDIAPLTARLLTGEDNDDGVS